MAEGEVYVSWIARLYPPETFNIAVNEVFRA